mgnify:CR=1 FL=1
MAVRRYGPLVALLAALFAAPVQAESPGLFDRLLGREAEENQTDSQPEDSGEFWETDRDPTPIQPIGVPTTFADLAEEVSPAVVNIRTSQTVTGMPGMPPQLEEFFGMPFGGRGGQEHKREGAGSGFVISTDGYIVTNNHVIDGMDEIFAVFKDGRDLKATVVGRDPKTDIALIKVESATPLPAIALGDSDAIRPGDWVVAIGNPFGLESTVTLGIISNLNRNVSQLGISGKRLDLIQTDAAINPGNSGGPLLNADGEVVGINTLVRSGPGAGLGFAIPINRAQAIARELVKTGRVQHPMVGIGLSPVPAPSSGVAMPAGAVIRSVQPGGPADKAGLKVDDVIISVDGRTMKGPAAVVGAIESRGVGERLRITVRRGAEELTLEVRPVDLSTLQPA